MKVKPGFELRNVCGENVIMATGIDNVDYSKLLVLTESAALLFRLIEKDDLTADQLADALCEEYEVERSKALADVQTFMQQMHELDVAE